MWGISPSIAAQFLLRHEAGEEALTTASRQYGKLLAVRCLGAAILVLVTTPPWDALAAPFAATDVQWRVVQLSADKLSAQVRPQLPAAAIRARLHEVLGVAGWSFSFQTLGERGLSCMLGVGGVQKSAVAPYSPWQTLSETAEDAFVAAAGLFEMHLTLALIELPWVDYDAEGGHILYEPDLEAPDRSEGVLEASEGTDRAEPEPGGAPLLPAPVAASAKSAGQQAIDKLVDRLKAEGRGLEAAKLLNAYGGYGSDPQTARELYAKLRELLFGGATP